MSDPIFKTAWRLNGAQHAADAKAFWLDLNLLNAQEAERRVSELCSMAYADGKLGGVTTVAPAVLPQLRCRLAFYRCAVAPEFRRHYLATMLTRHTLTTMEAWSLENPQEKLLGIAAILQAQELGSKGVTPHWAIPVDRGEVRWPVTPGLLCDQAPRRG